MSHPCSLGRALRRSFLSLVVLAPAALAGDIQESYAPAAVVLSPGARFPGNPVGDYTVVVEGRLGPVNGAYVEIEFSPEAVALVSWCAAPYGGPEWQAHPIVSGFTDAQGQITFEFYGGGCLDPGLYSGSTFIAQVRADGIVLAEPYIVSPDAVYQSGLRATEDPGPGGTHGDTRDGTPVAQVTLSDAVFHTRPIKHAMVEPCSKVTPPFNQNVSVSDAVFLTPYIKTSSFCFCQ